MKEKYSFDLFKNIELFSSLSDEELLQISHSVTIKKFKKNEIILREEETNQFMYIILTGKVKVIQTSEDGKETILAMHQSGDFFGEMSLIDGKTVPANVVATEDTLVAISSKEEFFRLIFSQNRVLEKLLEIFCSRLRESWNRIQLLNFKNASQRLKMLFYILSNEYGKRTPDTITLDIKLTHQNIADMTGMTRETVTRVLDKLQKDGELKISKNSFILLSSDFMKKGLNLHNLK